MFNLGKMLPRSDPTEYQKPLDQKETDMSNKGDCTFSVGPSDDYPGGALLVFSYKGDMNTTIQMGYQNARQLIDLLEAVISEPAGE